MSEVSVVRQEPLQLNRLTTQVVERGGMKLMNRPEGVLIAWEPPPGFDPQAHAQQHNLTNIGYETHTNSITGETHSVAYTEMTHEEYEELRQSPKARALELPPMVPEKIGNNFGKITFKPAANPVRAEHANPPVIPPEDVENPEAPPGERTSKKLDDLKAQHEANNKKLINTDAADEYVRFDDLHGSLNDLISNIKGEPGTLGDYAAQGTRALLGFTKDALVGVGELAYEGSKLAFDAQQAMMTPAGIQGQILEAQILLEEIRLGNVTTGTMSNGAVSTVTSVGKAIAAPVTDPWAQGQYVESITRATVEIATLPFVALKSSKAAKTGDVINDAATVNKAANAASDASDAAKAPELEGPNGDGGRIEKKEKIVRTAAQDREEITRLSNEAAEARKAGNDALADAKLAEAREILKPHIPTKPGDTWDGFIERLDVSTPKDGAVLWSGNQPAAQKFAEGIGGTTLEATPGGRVINGWDEVNNIPWSTGKGQAPGSGELWNGTSKKFAQSASGEVHVVQRPVKLWDQETVWHNTEKPEIIKSMESGKVTKVNMYVLNGDSHPSTYALTGHSQPVPLSENYVNGLLKLKGAPR